MSDENGVIVWRDRTTDELKSAELHVVWHYLPRSENDCHEIGAVSCVDLVAVGEDAYREATAKISELAKRTGVKIDGVE